MPLLDKALDKKGVWKIKSDYPKLIKPLFSSQ